MSRLLIVSPCQGAYGGIEAFVLALAEAVRLEREWEVRVVFKKTRDFTRQISLATMLAGTGAELMERAGKGLAEAIRWADMVHAQNAPPDVIALAKLARKPIVLTIHNHLRRGADAHRLAWQGGARLANACWYNSQFVWDTWEGPRKRRRSRKIPTVSRLPQGWTPPAERRGFIFVGRWIPNKGVDTLLHAYLDARLDRARWPLTLVGDGPLRSQLQNRITGGRASHIQSPGFVPELTRNELLRRARWIVIPPQTQEDFGLTALEARSLGIPCLITRDGGLPEAGGRHALVCEPGDTTGLTQLLERAAAMGREEYLARATGSREDLAKELMPFSFYPRAYGRVLTGEPAC